VPPPLADWNVPTIEGIPCSRELSSADVQTGTTIISDDCVLVPDTVEIGAGATLRISAGVVMKFAEGAELIVPRDATLTVNGTRQTPVVLTGLVNVPGYWGGIEFKNSTSRGNLLRGSVIQYAGDVGTGAALTVVIGGKSRFRMEDTLVRFSRPNAINFNFNGTVIDSFQGNRITENENIGAVSLDLLKSLDGTSEFTGNDVDILDVPRNQYDFPITIPDLGVPMDSVIRVDGAITANGTANDPILIQAVRSSRVQGGWVGFQLSGRGDKTFNHMSLNYAGQAGFKSMMLKSPRVPVGESSSRVRVAAPI